jgi:hypothetical protein
MPNYLVQAQPNVIMSDNRCADGSVTTNPQLGLERGLAWPDAGEADQPRTENRDP